MDKNIAVGVKVFSRPNKLSNLLNSIDHQNITTVYVADDGERSKEKSRIYDQEYPFELTVFDLPYDAGLGQGRAHIVENFSEEYLLIVDSDHRLPEDISPLYAQLRANQTIGGVSGLLCENERITATCHDIYVKDGLLIRDVRERKPVHIVAGHPFVQFDFIPNIALFRKGCVEDYCWDPEYVIGKEHLDFYTGHMENTDWTFGVCPAVLFEHHPGGDTKYVKNRESRKKLLKSRRYFLDKWGYRDIVLGYTEWDGPPIYRPTWGDILKNIYKKSLLASPSSVQNFIMRLRSEIRRYRHRPPI
jgi:glycosyltransferase involved in cell wall biosynthesis